MSLQNKKVLLIIGGGISAYKSLDLIRLLLRKKSIANLSASALVAAVGRDKDKKTQYGLLYELREYRTLINPIIDEVSAIEREVRDRAVDKLDSALAEKLDEVYREVRPELLEVLVELDRIEPPPGLYSLHTDIRRLILLRLDAYAFVIEGVATGNEVFYEAAEQKLRAANELIPHVNERLCEVDIALGDLEDCRLVA